MKEETMYEPVRKWLRSRGYRALVTGGKKEASIFVGDILPAKANIEPDVVGITDSWSDNVCVEVKAEIGDIFEVIGKCKIWQLASKHVYLAVPPSDGFRTEGLAAMGLGLLFVTENSVQEVLKPNYYGTTDTAKSQELFNQAFRAVKSHYGVIESTYPSANSHVDKWMVKFVVKNVGSRVVKISDVLLDGVSYLKRNCRILPKAPADDAPIEVKAADSCELLLEIPKESGSRAGVTVKMDFRVEDGIEKGSSFYLPS